MLLNKQDILRLLTDYNNKIFLQSDIYFVPDKKFFIRNLDFLRIFCKVYKIRYTELFNCIRFSDLYKTVCFYRHKKVEGKEYSSLSIGNIFFIKKDNAPHVRNIFFYQDDGLVKLGFIDAQTFCIKGKEDMLEVQAVIL